MPDEPEQPPIGFATWPPPDEDGEAAPEETAPEAAEAVEEAAEAVIEDPVEEAAGAVEEAPEAPEDGPYRVPERWAGELSGDDIRLFARAVRGDWPVPPALRCRVINTLGSYFEDDVSPVALGGEISLARLRLAASKALVDCTNTSLRQMELDLKREMLELRKELEAGGQGDVWAECVELMQQRMASRALEAAEAETQALEAQDGPEEGDAAG